MKVLIVDDHPIVLEGSKNLFSDIINIDVTTTTEVKETYRYAKEKAFDVYLIDVNLPEMNGVDLAAVIKNEDPQAIVILYTGDNIEDYYSLILEKKVNGLLSKTASKAHILRVLYASLENQLIVPDNFLDYIHETMTMHNTKKKLQLNEREKKILQYVVKGYTNQAIAIELNLTQRTIERNLSQIYHVLGVGSRTEAVVTAKELQLI